MTKYIAPYDFTSNSPPLQVRRTDYPVVKRLAIAMCIVNGEDPHEITPSGDEAFKRHEKAAADYLLADAAMDLVKRGHV